MKQTEKPKYNMLQGVGFMLRYAWKYRKRVIWFGLILVVLDVALNLTQLYLAPSILQQVEQTAPLGELLSVIGFFTLGLILLRAVKRYLDSNVQPSRIDVRSQIINDINHKACVTSYPNVFDPLVDRIRKKASETTYGNDKATEAIWITLTNLMINCTGFVIYLSMLSGLNWIMMTVILVTSIASFLIGKRIHEWGYRHREEESKYWVKLNYIQYKSSTITLAKDIRIFGLQDWLEDVWNSVIGLFEAFHSRKERVYIWANVADVIFSLARNGIAYFYLINLTLTQGLPASEFLLYFNAASGFSSWITGILRDFSTLHQQCLELSAVQEYLNLPEQFCFEGGEPIPEADGWELQMENVTFRYPETDKVLFQNFNLTVKAGEKLAVVGLNGAGKTTLVKLLCGFYDPDEGRVLLNGMDIRRFNRQEYYKLFSAVFQDYSHLDITVAENVAQDVENIDIPRVTDCLEKAGLTKMIEELPKGLDTHVGREVYLDGVLFSGGQMQRLMLARALYKNGGILILDEPTAALDPLAEHDIYMKYSDMTAGKTSVFISHRLASTRFCDRIVFLAEGKIAEEGTHEELLKKSGGYAQLFEVQSRYYQEGRDFRGEERK